VNTNTIPRCTRCGSDFVEEHNEPLKNLPRSTSIYPLVETSNNVTHKKPPSQGFSKPLYRTLTTNNDGDELYSEDSLPDLGQLNLKYAVFSEEERNISDSKSNVTEKSEESDSSNRTKNKEPRGGKWIGYANVFNRFFGAISEGLQQLDDAVDEFSYVVAPNLRRFKHGAPPAADVAIENCRKIKLDAHYLKEQASCPVCVSDLSMNEEVRQLPCGHYFHDNCIIPWLKKRNSCPICRFELKTSNRKYERYKGYRDQGITHTQHPFNIHPKSNPVSQVKVTNPSSTVTPTGFT
jgi:hypothetical protein